MIFEGRFANRRAIVTGGASGIGLAVAKRLAAEGAAVCLWDLDQAALDRAASEVGRSCFGVQVDVSTWSEVERAANDSIPRLGGVDVLVACAGITGPNAVLWEYPVDKWRQVMEVNIDGIFHCNRAVVPHMLQGGYGRIVNVASVAGKEGNPNASAYSSSKAAVIGLTKSLGKELATKNITVNAVTPAAVRTPIFAQMTQAHIDYMLSKIPMGRFGEVEEITALICWIASEECSFTTASVFDATGGRSTY